MHPTYNLDFEQQSSKGDSKRTREGQERIGRVERSISGGNLVDSIRDHEIGYFAKLVAELKPLLLFCRARSGFNTHLVLILMLGGSLQVAIGILVVYLVWRGR